MLAAGSLLPSLSMIVPACAVSAIRRPPIASVCCVTASFTLGTGRNAGAGVAAGACAPARSGTPVAKHTARIRASTERRTSAARRFAVEPHEIGLERTPSLVVEVHQMPRRIESVLDVRAKRGVEAEMVEGV